MFLTLINRSLPALLAAVAEQRGQLDLSLSLVGPALAVGNLSEDQVDVLLQHPHFAAGVNLTTSPPVRYSVDAPHRHPSCPHHSCTPVHLTHPAHGQDQCWLAKFDRHFEAGAATHQLCGRLGIHATGSAVSAYDPDTDDFQPMLKLRARTLADGRALLLAARHSGPITLPQGVMTLLRFTYTPPHPYRRLGATPEPCRLLAHCPRTTRPRRRPTGIPVGCRTHPRRCVGRRPSWTQSLRHAPAF